jgi:hypothetical protein
MVQWPLGADQAVGLPEQDLPPLWLVRSSPGTRKKMGRETGPIRLGTLIFPIFLWIDMGFRWFWVICVLLIYIYTYLRWFWVICTVMCVCGFPMMIRASYYSMNLVILVMLIHFGVPR